MYLFSFFPKKHFIAQDNKLILFNVDQYMVVEYNMTTDPKVSLIVRNAVIFVRTYIPGIYLYTLG